jgi:hypothetical protein
MIWRFGSRGICPGSHFAALCSFTLDSTVNSLYNLHMKIGVGQGV